MPEGSGVHGANLVNARNSKTKCVARYDEANGIRCGIPGKEWTSEQDMLSLNQRLFREEKGLCKNCISFRNANRLAKRAKAN